MERTERHRHRIDGGGGGGDDVDDAVTQSLRLIPFTRHSLRRLKDRNTARKNHRDCHINLPECELVSVSTSELTQSKIFNIPLEDVSQFGNDKTFCVLVKRSDNQYLYRFSAESSLYIFSPWSPIRIFAIRISCHRFFELFVMTTILLNCVFLALSQPIEETEYVFLVIYTVEMVIKTTAKGFIFNKYAYLRNPWNWLDFVVVLSGYVTLGLQAIGLSIGNLAGLRTFRVLRALKTVSITPGLKTIVNAMLHSVGMLAEVMTLTVFCLMVFALLALQLYNGVLRQKCVLDKDDSNPQNASNPSPWLTGLDGQPVICGTKFGTRYCPKNYTCTPGFGENPNYGYTSFDSYGWALLTTFQLITLDFWEDIYNKINDAIGPASLLYFMLVVFFGSFYLINLTLAVVAIAYEEEAATTLKEQNRVKKISTGFPKKLATTLAAITAKRKILPFKIHKEESLEKWCTPRKNISCSPAKPEKLVRINVPLEDKPSLSSSSIPQDRERNKDGDSRDASDDDPHPLCMGAPDIIISTGAKLPITRVKDVAHTTMDSSGIITESREISDSGQTGPRLFIKRFQPHLGKSYQQCDALIQAIDWFRHFLEKLVNDPLFDLMITVCILLNTAFLSVEHHGMTTKMERILKLGNLVFTIIFCLEAAGKLLALGRRYFRSKWNVFDMVVVGLSLADLSFETVSGLSVLRTFRLLRVVKLAQAWPTMRLLLTIIASSLGAVGNMTLVLAVIVYIFAILGVQLFSDVYTAEKFAPDPVPRWNFTDFFHSLLMVFRILCGEWVQPLWDCMRASDDKYQVCIVLFLAALTVGNFLVLNLFLAMLLNSFNTQQLQEKKEETATDSKVLRGFQRIKGVICRNNTSILSGNATSLRDSNCRTMSRRWSEPGTPLRLATTYRRQSDVFHSIPMHLRKGDHEHFYHKQFAPLHLESLISSPTSGTLSQDEMQEEEEQMEGSGDQINGKKMKKKKAKIKDAPQPPPCCPLFCTVRFSSVCSPRCLRIWNVFRRTTLSYVDHKTFEWAVLFLIFASSVVLCFEDAFLHEKPQLLHVLEYINLIFTSFFVLEVLLRWIAHGFVVYFSSLWTTMDFIIVCVSVASVILESSGSSLYALRAIRTLRALRPLRAISRWQGMKIVVNALVSAVPSIFNVLLVCLVFWLIFGIMGVQFFGGKFYRCVDDVGRRLPVETVSNYNMCLTFNYSWINKDINFDNVGNAYLALFQVATFEGWTEIMEDAADSTEVDRQPYAEANFTAHIYFVAFIICGSFFTLNLFIGVIIDNFNMLKKKYEGGIVEMFLTDSQRTYYTAMLKLGRKKPQRIITRPKNPYLRVCHDIATSRKFELLVFVLIILNMVAMTVEHYQQPEDITVILETLNIIFTAIFAIEAVIKILGLRHYYFIYPWNIFDCCVLITSVVGIVFEEALQKLVISPTLLRVIRLVRIGRILRLIKAAKGIRKLLFALVISLPALFNIGALLFLVMFVYAIIGMSLFGHVKPSGALTERVNFQTFAKSMVLLFRLTTSAGWNDVLESLMIQPPDCDPAYKSLPNGNCGHPIAAVAYLVTYIIINFMVVINMYIAIILENLSQANKEDSGITEDDIEMFYVCWAHYDPNATQFINYNQLSDFVASLDPPLGIEKPNEPALVAMNLPIANGERIHCLDVLHSLVNLVLGDVEDTEEFRIVQRQIDRRFRKTFPTRNQVEIISTTFNRKKQDHAAKIIQRVYRRHLKIKRTALQNNQRQN